ncbi:MAG: HPr family phosphocarrier protein [Eubacteriales bacterium]|nr:HPr family phosphocarrier protein [Eubacteriales bacterium]
MTCYIKIETVEDLQKFMNLAWNSPMDVGVHTKDNQIADGKSVLGLMAIDYERPVMVVTEDERLVKQLRPWMVEG